MGCGFLRSGWRRVQWGGLWTVTPGIDMVTYNGAVAVVCMGRQGVGGGEVLEHLRRKQVRVAWMSAEKSVWYCDPEVMGFGKTLDSHFPRGMSYHAREHGTHEEPELIFLKSFPWRYYLFESNVHDSLGGWKNILQAFWSRWLHLC